MANSSDSSSIGSLLLIATCTVAMLPAAMLAGWLIAQDRAGNAGGMAPERAIADAEAFADTLDQWLIGTLQELRAWGEIPALVEGVRRAAVEHHERGYTEETPEDVNAQLVHDGHLGLAPQADEYLAAQVARSPSWSQVHYSDEYGFTVGRIGVEDDFVQTDENWWRRAWAQGRYEGPVGLDPTIGELGIRLALRIDDPATGAAVGVIDGMIGVAAIHELATEFAQRSGTQVRILDADGALVAETASGHARDRVLKLSHETMNREGWRVGVGDTGRSGGSVDAGVERGWVRLAGAEGPHRDWIVIAERHADPRSAPGGGIRAAVAGVVLAVLTGLVGGLWLRQRVGARLGDLAGAVERLGDGDIKNAIPAEGNDDIARIGRGVEKMRGTMRRALQIINRQPA